MNSIKLSTARINIGLQIQLPCPWREHPFLFTSFKIENQDQINALRSLTCKQLLYIPEKSDTSPLPIMTDKKVEISAKTMKASADIFWQEKQRSIEEQKSFLRKLQSYEDHFERSLSMIRAINLKLENQAPQALIDAKELISDISEKLNDASLVLHLMEGGEGDDKEHHHTLHVAILAMILGKAMALSEQELAYLGLGALFHDLGKSKIPAKILHNRPYVTPAENNYYKMHVRYAMEKINNITDFPDTVTEIVNQHHEFLDGSGYPKKLKGEQINLLAQIVSIANEYDNMRNPADKHPIRSPYHALAHLHKHQADQLNKKALGLLENELGTYPPGSIVQLCNEQYALVVSPNKGNIQEPNVIIYDPSVPKSDAAIISLSETELAIEQAICPNKLPENIQEYLNLRARVNYY